MHIKLKHGLYIPSYKLDYDPSTNLVMSWQHHAEDHTVSSIRSLWKQPFSLVEETNLIYLDAHDSGVSLRKSKGTLILESIKKHMRLRKHVARMEDYQVSDVSMATNVKGMSFDQMNQEDADCKEPFVGSVT